MSVPKSMERHVEVVLLCEGSEVAGELRRPAMVTERVTEDRCVCCLRDSVVGKAVELRLHVGSELLDGRRGKANPPARATALRVLLLERLPVVGVGLSGFGHCPSDMDACLV